MERELDGKAKAYHIPESGWEEIPERLKNSESITESWKQPLQKPEESPVKIKVERDILRQNSEKARELMRIQKQQIQALEEEKQMLLSDRQRLRGEVQKSIEEMHRLKIELSETQRLNQSLQQSNDNLRNRNGMMSRREQEQLENEIRDVRDRNSKLQIQVNKSSVEAVDEAQRKQKNDFIDFFRVPSMWYVRFCDWLVYPTYDNGFNQKIAYTNGEAWFIRIMAIVAVLFILTIVMVIIVEAIKRYKKLWDEISQMFLIGSLSGIAVLGEIIREYLRVNLILLFVFINVGIMLIRVYLQKKFDYL